MGRGRKRHRRAADSQLKTGQSGVEKQPSRLPHKQEIVGAAPTAATIPPPKKLELVPIAPVDVDVMWPLAYDLIESELPKTDWTPDQLQQACAHGHATLWMVCDENDEALAAMVTILTARERCLVAICSGRNLFDFVDARHQLYGWAKSVGMKEVTFYGRDALAKLMPECKRAGVILRKEL
jgi:hypothetical protein